MTRQPVSYGEFGRLLMEYIVTADRLEERLSNFASATFSTNVRMVGAFLRGEGEGKVTKISVDRLDDDEVLRFRAALRAELSLTVRISGLPYRYLGLAEISLEPVARTMDDVSIFIEIPDVSADDVVLDLNPIGRVAAILDTLDTVNDQVRSQIVKYINQLKDAPRAMQERAIDVRSTIEDEYERRKAN